MGKTMLVRNVKASPGPASCVEIWRSKVSLKLNGLFNRDGV